MQRINSNERNKNRDWEEEELRNWLLDQPEGIVSAEELCTTH